MTLDITINITFCSQPKFNPVKLHYLMLLSGKISSNFRLNVLLIGKLTPNRFLLFFFLILINQNKMLSGGFKKNSSCKTYSTWTLARSLAQPRREPSTFVLKYMVLTYRLIIMTFLNSLR